METLSLRRLTHFSYSITALGPFLPSAKFPRPKNTPGDVERSRLVKPLVEVFLNGYIGNLAVPQVLNVHITTFRSMTVLYGDVPV